MTKFAKYFTEQEFACKCCGQIIIHADLVSRLDLLRGLYGRPLRITSGYRCSERNRAVGGKSDSAHMMGKAADIAAGSEEKFDLLGLIIRERLFQRIGISKEFLHVDIDSDKAQRVVWTY